MSAWASALALLLAAVPQPQPFTFQDPSITESSAIVVVGDTYFTINDSGDEPRVFAVDASGRTVGITSYGADVTDVEALDAGPGSTLYVGDIGDNDSERSHITVYRIDRIDSGDREVTPTAYDLVYADGPHDAEALMVHPRTGRVYVVSKGDVAGTVYAAPEKLRSDQANVLEPVGTGAPRMVTDGAFLPDGRHAVVRNYASATVLETEGWTAVGKFFLPMQPQGEGIDVVGDQVVLSSEGKHAEVRFETIPDDVLSAMGPQEPEPVGTATPTPSAPDDDERDSPEGRNWVPVGLGAVGVLVLVLLVGIRASRRRSRHTQ